MYVLYITKDSSYCDNGDACGEQKIELDANTMAEALEEAKVWLKEEIIDCDTEGFDADDFDDYECPLTGAEVIHVKEAEDIDVDDLVSKAKEMVEWNEKFEDEDEEKEMYAKLHAKYGTGTEATSQRQGARA